MKKFFIEIQCYSAGMSRKGKLLQEQVECQYHRSVAYSEKALEDIIGHVRNLAKSLDHDFPRTKPFQISCYNTDGYSQYTVYMRPGELAPICLKISSTEITAIYESTSEVGLSRIYSQKGGKR